MAQLRPARFHRHDPTYWPGEDDVHGSAPRPRYHKFGAEPGTTYVAFADHDSLRDTSLTRIAAVYMPFFQNLFAKRPAFQFKIVPGTHWIYNGVAADIVPMQTIILWWRRPISTLKKLDDYTFPWDLDTPMRFFTAGTHEYACAGMLRAFAQDQGRAATGYAVVDVKDVGWAPGIAADLRRAFDKDDC